MPMSRRRWVLAVAATVLLLVILPAILFPHPEVWEHLWSDSDHARAVLVAYRVAIGTNRPSGVPLNGLTYTFAFQRVSRDDLDVVFLPRMGLQRHVFKVAAEEIHVVLRTPSMDLVRWHFAE
jgi:hypothetical protein